MTTHSVSAMPVSARQRLIDDMTMRRFSRATQRNYLRDIGRLAAFLERSPDTIGFAFCRHASDGAQITGDVDKAVCCKPPLHLLIEGRLRRQVLRHEAPWNACLHHVWQPVEDLAEVVVALTGFFVEEPNIRRDDSSFFIGNVGRAI